MEAMEANKTEGMTKTENRFDLEANPENPDSILGTPAYCPYCGQTYMTGHIYDDDAEARAAGIERCRCGEALAEKEKQEVVRKATELMGENCARYGVRGEVDTETQRLVLEAIDIVFGDFAAKVTVQVDGGDVIQIKKDSNNYVRVARTQKAVGQI